MEETINNKGVKNDLSEFGDLNQQTRHSKETVYCDKLSRKNEKKISALNNDIATQNQRALLEVKKACEANQILTSKNSELENIEKTKTQNLLSIIDEKNNRIIQMGNKLQLLNKVTHEYAAKQKKTESEIANLKFDINEIFYSEF